MIDFRNTHAVYNFQMNIFFLKKTFPKKCFQFFKKTFAPIFIWKNVALKFFAVKQISGKKVGKNYMEFLGGGGKKFVFGKK